MGKIVFKHLQLNQGDLAPFADLVYRKVFENPTYTKLQPLIIALKPLTETYDTALLIAKDGGKDRTKAKDVAKEALMSHLTKLGMTIELESNGDEDYITETGFPVREVNAKRTVTYLNAPINFRVKNDDLRKGVLNLSWKKVENANTYIIEELVGEDIWKRAISSSSLSAQLTNLTPNTTKIYRVFALGSGNLVSDYSDSVTITVNP